ncbi:MAG: DUF2182 domain-containing protein [Chloroflexota bacterium]|nr:DUF2182 domain-containing protein [Chloroflexota bacterium]
MKATASQATPAGRSHWWRPKTSLERGQLAVLLAVIILTIGSWLLTLHQAWTMDMPMGVAVRGGASAQTTETGEPVVADAGPEAGDQPKPEDGMAGMDMPGMTMVAPTQPGAETASSLPAAPEPGMAMAGMAAEGWSLGGFTAFLVAWAVMMAAMMFPAAAPMLLLFRRVSTQRQVAGNAFVPTWVFAAGYLLVWTAIGALVWVLVQLGSDLATNLGSAQRAAWAPLALGTTLMIAGIYQFTPLKRVCLRHCQSPLGFVLGHWREGRVGALQMGVRHGAYCLGCCWALFAVLVATGVMSLAWMLLLTLVVFAEKVLPIGRGTSRAVGAAFLVFGVLVASGATAMPWMA